MDEEAQNPGMDGEPVGSSHRTCLFSGRSAGVGRHGQAWAGMGGRTRTSSRVGPAAGNELHSHSPRSRELPSRLRCLAGLAVPARGHGPETTLP